MTSLRQVRLRFLIGLTTLLLLSVFSSARAAVFISEIFWMGSDLSTSDEWVELAGAGSGTDVSGWTLTSLNSSGNEVIVARFGTGTVIGSGQYVVISRFPNDQSRLANDPFVLSSTMTLPNTKLLVRLRDASGNIVDQADDGNGNPLAGRNASSDKASMERIGRSLNGSDVASWRTATGSIGFDTSPIHLYGSPGFGFSSSAQSSSSSMTSSSAGSSPFSSSLSSSIQSSSSSSSSAQSSHASWMYVTISEVLPNPIGVDDSEWIELHAGSGATTLSGLTLFTSGSSKGFTFGSGDALSVDGYLAFSKVRTGLILPNGSGSVRLMKGTQTVSSLAYPSLPEGVSFGLKQGGTIPLCVPTMGSSNEDGTWSADIVVQSGTPVAEGSVSINIQIASPDDQVQPESCRVEYGDGSTSTSCNPPSHSYASVGSFSLDASMTNFCGTTIDRSLQIRVLPRSSSSSSLSSSSSTTVTAVSQSSRSSSSFSASSASVRTRGDSIIDLTVRVLPNPAGKDTKAEWLEIKNEGTETIDTGWLWIAINDKAAKQFPSAQLGAGRTKRFTSDLLKVTIPNTNGTVIISDGLNGTALDTVEWDKAEEDVTYPDEVSIAPKSSVSSSSKGIKLALVNEEKSEHKIYSLNQKIYVSEVFPVPFPEAENPLQSDEWIELFNPNEDEVDLGGWQLLDSAKKQKTTSVLADGTTIEAGEYLVVFAHDVGLTLNNDEDSVYLLDPNGDDVDHVSYAKVKSGQSLAKFWNSDGDTDDCVTDNPTPGGTNGCVGATSVSVSKKGSATSAKAKSSASPFPVTYKNSGDDVSAGSGIPTNAYAGMLIGGEKNADEKQLPGSGAVGWSIFSFAIGIAGGMLFEKYRTKLTDIAKPYVEKIFSKDATVVSKAEKPKSKQRKPRRIPDDMLAEQVAQNA